MRWWWRTGLVGVLGVLMAGGVGGLGRAEPPGGNGPPVGEVSGVAPGVRYGWPLTPVPRVTRPFDEPPFRYGRGVRSTSEYLDPLVLLRPRFVRLYPLPEP